MDRENLSEVMVILENYRSSYHLKSDFPLHAAVESRADVLVEAIRRSLGLNPVVQAGWRSAGAALNHLRDTVDQNRLPDAHRRH